MKRSEARGTWLESHFRWQIRTFWFGALWVALCALFVVFTLGLGLFLVWLPLGIVALWFIYRVARGWMALNDRRRCTHDDATLGPRALRAALPDLGLDVAGHQGRLRRARSVQRLGASGS